MNDLYLYQSADESRVKSLINNELFFTYPESFNDPYDCDFKIDNDLENEVSAQGHSVKSIRALLKGYYDKTGSWDAYLIGGTLANCISHWVNGDISSEKLCGEIRDHFKKNVGVRCFFSEAPYPVEMWAHYANNHTGFCVQYSGHMHAQSVNYMSGSYFLYLSEFLFSSRNISNHLLTNKDSIWASEREVRLALLPPIKESLKKGFTLPITHSSINMQVKAVYLGFHIHDKIKFLIREYAKVNSISVFECKPADDRSIFNLVESV